MCGDHDELYFQIRRLWGSPPHVRGPLGPITIRENGNGITPACAGTTGEGDLLPLLSRDHPRMCGDHSFSIYSIYTRMGSPPHVRGPQFQYILDIYQDGITPACAGTTIIYLVC